MQRPASGSTDARYIGRREFVDREGASVRSGEAELSRAEPVERGHHVVAPVTHKMIYAVDPRPWRVRAGIIPRMLGSRAGNSR